MKRLFQVSLLVFFLANLGVAVEGPPFPKPLSVFTITQGQDWKQYYRSEYYQLSYTQDFIEYKIISTTHTTAATNTYPTPAIWVNFQLEKPMLNLIYRELSRDQWLNLVTNSTVADGYCDSYVIVKR